MNIKTWVWCLHCERAFAVLLSRVPTDEESALDFVPDLEMQLGVELHGQIYAECEYEDCDGGPLDFWWWDRFRATQEGLPEVPELDKEYPLYPE